MFYYQNSINVPVYSKKNNFQKRDNTPGFTLGSQPKIVMKYLKKTG